MKCSIKSRKKETRMKTKYFSVLLIALAMSLASCNFPSVTPTPGGDGGQDGGGSHEGGDQGGDQGGEEGGEGEQLTALEQEVKDFLAGRNVTGVTVPFLKNIKDADIELKEVEPQPYEEEGYTYPAYFCLYLTGNYETSILASLNGANWTVPTTPDEEYGYECVDPSEKVEVDVMYYDEEACAEMNELIELFGGTEEDYVTPYTDVSIYAKADIPDDDDPVDPVDPGDDDELTCVDIVFGDLNLAAGDFDNLNVNGVALEAAQNSGQSHPAYNASNKDLRLYAQNSLNIAVEGLRKIEFTFNSNGSKAYAEVTADKGDISFADDNLSGVWTGSTDELTLTLGSSGQRRILEMKVYFTGEAGDDPVDPGDDSYTIAGVVNDINAAFASIIGGDLLEYDADEEGYAGALNFSDDGVDYSDTKAAESVLKPVVETLEYYMPEYLVLSEEKYYAEEDDYWGDESGDTAYDMILVTPDLSVGVELYSYCYNGMLIGAIFVFEPESPALPEIDA